MVFIYESAKALVAEVNFVFVYVPHPRHPILLAAFAAVIVLTVAVSLQMTVRGRGAGRGLGRLDSGERVTIVVLALTGVCFWASMVLLKSSRHFNALDARLLAPGTVLVTAAALSGLAARGGFREHRGVKAATVLIVLASVAYTSVYRPLAQYRAQPILFPERLQNIRASLHRCSRGHSSVVRSPALAVPPAGSSSHYGTENHLAGQIPGLCRPSSQSRDTYLRG